MKNQYVADIGDYGKYGMLRFFALQGVNIGVNWYLTSNDGSTDGKFIDYLKQPERFQMFDSVVFNKLMQIAEKGGNKSVEDVKNLNIIPGAVFFSEYLNTDTLHCSERNYSRDIWFNKSLETLLGANLVFADPDNGVLTSRKKKSSKGAQKYITRDELSKYYQNSNVVYYCHKGRRSLDDWNEKKYEMKDILMDVQIRILTYHRGTQRSFIFLIHPDSIKQYDKLIDEFLKTKWGNSWNSPFTRE